MNKLFLIAFTLLSFSTLQAKNNFSFISPADPSIVYEGRIDFSNPKKPTFSYCGVSILAAFEGTYIDVLFQDYGTGGPDYTNYFNISIDGQPYFVLKVTNTQKIYRVAENLKPGDHSIYIVKRTESFVGKTTFLGFQLEKGAKLVSDYFTAVGPVRRIEFIGNSLTTGYGNELSIPAPPEGNPNTGFDSKNENNSTAWGALTCADLHAHYMCTAYSGRGLYRNNTGSTTGTMPLVYDRIIPDEENSYWNYQRYIPDVIVVDIGSNDFAKGVLDSATFVTTYIDFVNKLRGYYPEATIICVAGNAMSDYWPEGEFRWTHMQNYVTSTVNYFNNKGDKNVYYLKLDPQQPPYGEDWHPSNATHRKMADVTVAFIKQIKGW